MKGVAQTKRHHSRHWGATLLLVSVLALMLNGTAQANPNPECPTILQQLSLRAYKARTTVKQWLSNLSMPPVAAWGPFIPDRSEWGRQVKKETLDGKPGEGQGETGGEERNPGRPPMGDAMMAHNKDTDLPPSDQPLVEVASVPVPRIGYWKAQHYQTMEPMLGMSRRQGTPVPLANDGRTYSVPLTSTVNHPRDVLLLPHGFEAGKSSQPGVQILRDEYGNFSYHSSVGRFDTPLAPIRPRDLTPLERKTYTTIEKVPTALWPAWLQQEIQVLRELRGAGWTNRQLAERLADTIGGRLYSVDKTPEKGLVALACAGKVQCDGAASIWVAVLRGEFKIPARVVSGFKGSVKDGEPERSVVVEPTMGHAWGEVYDDAARMWELMDPTPHKTDREKQHSDDHDRNSGYRQAGHDQPGEEKDQEKKGKGGDGASQESENAKTSENSENSEKGNPSEGGEKSDKSDASENSEGKNSAPSDPSDDSKTPQASKPSHANPQPRALLSPQQEAAIRDRAVAAEAAWIHTLEGMGDRATFTQRLKNFRIFLDRQRAPIQNAYAQRLAQLESAAALVGDYDSWESFAREWEPTTMTSAQHNQLNLARLALEELSKARPLNSEEGRSAELLAGLAAKKTDPVGLGKALWDRLPGPVSKAVLKEKYRSRNENAFFAQVGKAVEAGELDPLVRMVQLGNYLDISAITSPAPQRKYSTHWELQNLPTGRMTMVRADDVNDLPLVPMEGLPLRIQLARLAAQDLRRPKYFEERKTSEPVDPETTPSAQHWGLIVDTSSSMDQDNRSQLRDSLILGQLDHAFAEAAAKGTEVRVTLIEYNSDTRVLAELTEEKEAVRYFRKLLARPLANTGGTMSTPALALAFEKGADHQAAKLNLLMITDGDESMPLDTIREKRAALPQGAQVAFNAITLTTGNEDLKRIADGETKIEMRGQHQHIERQEGQRLSDTKPLVSLLTAMAPIDPNTAVTLPSSGELKAGFAALDYSLQSTKATKLYTLPSVNDFDAKGSIALVPTIALPVTERARYTKIYLDALAAARKQTPEQILREMPPSTRAEWDAWLGGTR